ncbi:MAG: hypothetical protein KKB63_16680, partial [Alphaproteobacteria bacterium]|nr:hypothetical protein [Alphaproteobacteria bacterium]
LWQSAGQSYSLIGSLPGDKLAVIARKIGETASGIGGLTPLRDDRRAVPPSSTNPTLAPPTLAPPTLAPPTLDRPALDKAKPERTSTAPLAMGATST